MGYKKVNFDKAKTENGQSSKKGKKNNKKMTAHKKSKYKDQW